MSGNKNQASQTEIEEPQQEEVWYHFLAKGWECPGHDNSYESSFCVGAVYVG